MSHRILLVEDDPKLGHELKNHLEKNSYTVDWAQTSAEATKSFESNLYSLLIFDIGLPDGSGLELAQKLKDSGNTTPFLFLTAAHDAQNRLTGYELGAEEFIPKPFHLRELILRVDHVLSTHPRNQSQVTINAGLLDLEKRTFTSASGQVSFFSSRDFEVLKLLHLSAPRPVSRDEILDKIWGEDSYPTHRTVDNSIVRLRSILNDDQGHIIRSVRGVGYQWVHT